MRFSTIITSAISAAAVVAAPVDKRALTTDWVVEVVTLTTTVYGSPTSSATVATSPLAALQQGGWGGHYSHSHSRRPQRSTSQAPAPTTTSSVVATPTPSSSTTSIETSAPAYTPTTTAAETTTVEPSSTAPQSTPPAQTGTPSSGACTTWQAPTDFSVPPESCGVSVLDTVNKYRVAYGKSPFVWSETIAKAAWNTLTYNKGGETMVHPGLVNGSGGEVITPGFWETGDKATQGDTPFEVALVAWLCEVSTDPELQASGFTGIDQCNIAHNVARISGSANPQEPTGHHDILLGDYRSIGCLFMMKDGAQNTDKSDIWPGQWTCDLGW